jgi:hypothetical protein
MSGRISYCKNINMLFEYCTLIIKNNSKRSFNALTDPTIVGLLKECCVMSHVIVYLSRWLEQVCSRPRFNSKLQLAKLTADHILPPSPLLQNTACFWSSTIKGPTWSCWLHQKTQTEWCMRTDTTINSCTGIMWTGNVEDYVELHIVVRKLKLCVLLFREI